MEYNSELVSIGRLLHEQSYRRERREEIIDNTIAIDFMRKGDILELHEVKKSNKMEKAHRFQMIYYLYYLKNKGVAARGIIDYPKLRKREYVELNDENEKIIVEVLDSIKRIISLSAPPLPRRKRICRNCSYYEFCFSGE